MGPHNRSSPRCARAFTLVEMLIIVAIIVALLAILMPSMNHAIYLATLTRCASNLKQTGYGYFNYAQDNVGRFRGFDHTKVTHLKEMASDMRPLYSPYVAFNELACPFLPSIDYLNPPITTQRIEWTYMMFAGFKMDGETKRLDRPGDYFVQYGRRHYILAADLTSVRVDGGSPQTSHPGFDFGLYLAGANPAPAVPTYTYPASHNHTFLRWEGSTFNSAKGRIDLNYLFTDGAVRTLFGIRHGSPQITMGSPFKGNGTWYAYMPPGN